MGIYCGLALRYLVTSAISLHLPGKNMPGRALRAAFSDRNLSLHGEDVPFWGKWLSQFPYVNSSSSPQVHAGSWVQRVG